MQEIKLSKLEEQTKLIKHYEKAWIDNALKIGEVLKEVNDSKSYKDNYKTFQEYVEANFSFTRQYAYNFIGLSEKYGRMSNQFDKLKTYGIKFLILTLAVPDDYIDEVIEEFKSKPEIKSKEAIKLLKRFSNQVGSVPRHSGSLNPLQRKEEHILKLKREAESIKDEFKTLQEIKKNLKESIQKWLSAAKFPELEPLKNDLAAILNQTF